MPPNDLGVLRERVYNAERQLTDIQGRLGDVATTDDLRAIGSQVSALSQKLDQLRTTNWPVLLLSGSLAVGILGGFGWIAYTPIRERQEEHKLRITNIEERIVPRSEHEREWSRQEKNRMEVTARIEDNQKALVNKDTFWQTSQGLQRQIDEICRDVGGVVTTRDALQAADRRIERLEAELRALVTNGKR